MYHNMMDWMSQNFNEIEVRNKMEGRQKGRTLSTTTNQVTILTGKEKG